MKHKKILKGTVVSHKMPKTAVVEVMRYFQHPLYRKYMKRSKRYKAHDENNAYEIGARVSIEESKPFSKGKKWIIVKALTNTERTRADAEVNVDQAPI